MADEASIGTVSISVVPDASGFLTKAEAAILPDAERLGNEIANRLSDSIARKLKTAIDEGLGGGAPATEGTKGGEEYGGAFGRAVKTRLEAALRDLPEAKLNADLSPAEAKLAELRAQLAGVGGADIKAGVSSGDTTAVISKIKAELDSLARSDVDIHIRVDAAAASAQLAALGTQIEALNKTDVSPGGGGSGVGSLVTAIAAVGPALIPLGAGIAAMGGALVAMGGVGVLAFLGIKNEMAAGTAAGLQYSAGLSTLKVDLTGLETIAAANVLGPFNTAVAQLHEQLPATSGLVGDLSKNLGVIGGNVITGIIGGFRTMSPLITELGVGAEKLSADFAKFSTGDGLAKFTAYAIQTLPQVEAFLGGTATAISHLVQGLAPLGTLSLGGLNLFVQVLDALPIGLIQAAAPAITAFMLALKLGQGLEGISTSLAKMGANLASTAAGSGVFAGAAGKVGGVVENVSSAFSKAGAVLPIVGVAVGVVTSIFQAQAAAAAAAFAQNVKYFDAIRAGGPAATAAASALNQQRDAAIGAGNGFGLVSGSAAILTSQLGKAKAASDAQYNSLSQGQKANVDVTNAQNAYNEAVSRFGASSAQAQYAAGTLQSATAANAKLLDDQATAAQSASESLQTLFNKELAATGSALALARANATEGKAQQSYDAVLANAASTADTKAKSESDLADSMLTGAEAAGTAAAATAKAAGVTDTSTASNQATLKSLQDYAAAAGGNVPASIAALIAKLEAGTASMQTTGGAAATSTGLTDDLSKALGSIPAAAYSTVNVDTANAVNNIAGVKSGLDSVQSKTVTVTVLTAAGGAVAGIANNVTGGFATGGLVTGPGTATSDDILTRLSNREFVSTAAATALAGNLSALEAANRGARLIAVGPQSGPAPSPVLGPSSGPASVVASSPVRASVGGNSMGRVSNNTWILPSADPASLIREADRRAGAVLASAL